MSQKVGKHRCWRLGLPQVQLSSKQDVPFFCAVGSIHRHRKDGPDPALGNMLFPPTPSPSVAALSFHWNILFQLLPEQSLCDLDKGGNFPIFVAFQPCILAWFPALLFCSLFE